jgi:hypothetical protein
MRSEARHSLRLCFLLILTAAVLLIPTAAYALPLQGLVLPDFAADPSGPAFTIQPVGTDPGHHDGSANIEEPPILEYGQTTQAGETASGDPHEPMDNNLRMTWNPTDPTQDARAGWELEFGTDPDLRGARMSLSVLPPGGVLSGPAPQFVGVSSISVVAVDGAGIIAGGWGFNTDQLGLAGAPANDLVGGGVSLWNNAMHNVLINIGTGPALVSALVTSTGPPLGPPVIGPNFVIPGNNNFGNIMWLQYYENGNLRGQQGIPGTGQTGMVNWWDHLRIYPTPEPTTMLLLGGGLLALARKRRRKR